MNRWLGASVAIAVALAAPRAAAHHEALFGPQSSLAVESPAFASLQMHVRATGSGASYATETTYIASAGFSPVRDLPWGITLVQPFTYEVARTPAGDQIGPSSSCGGCFRRENLLVGTQYRFDFTSLQRELGKDGNFALLSASLEPPTGNKDYPAFHGPANGIVAAMAGLEWRSLSAVLLGYYRINAEDGAGAKKGNNALAGIGLAYTPLDEEDRMVSFQLGVADEIHARDVEGSSAIDASGGWEILVSPTIVWSPASQLRFFTLASLPVAQDYRSAAQEDRWRAGLGVIYAFSRGEPAEHGH